MLQRQARAALGVMVQVFLVAIMCSFPAIVAAQDELPRIDWEIVFTDNADRVVTTQKNGREQRVLEFPNGITVQKIETADGTDIIASDFSENGAAGCLFAILVDVFTIANMCPADHELAQTELLQARLKRLSRFVGENSVPPIVGNDLEHALARLLSSKTAAYKLQPNVCEKDIEVFLNVFGGAEFEEEFEKGLRSPRLPVMNPCL